MNKLIVQNGLFLNKVAYFDNGKIIKIKLTNKNQKYFEKDIFIAKMKKKNVGMKSLALSLDEDTTGFMHYFSDEPSEYQLCQIKKVYTNGKNPKLTNEITLVGKYVIYIGNASGVSISNKASDDTILSLIKENISPSVKQKAKIVIRSSASEDNLDVILEEIEKLHKKFKELEQKAKITSKPQLLYRQYDDVGLCLSRLNKKVDIAIVNSKNVIESLKKSDFKIDEFVLESGDLFEKYGVNTEISALLQEKVVVENGINIYIQKTEAMNIVDVNSAGYIRYKDKNKNAYHINETVCSEIARQIELRDLSGIVLVDFIEMKDEKLSQKLVVYMQKQLDKYDRKATVTSMNKSNLMQIIRKKEGLSLSEVLLSNNIGLYSEDYIFENINEKLDMIYSEDMQDVVIDIPLFEDIKVREYVRKLEEKFGIKIKAKYLQKSDFTIKIKKL